MPNKTTAKPRSKSAKPRSAASKTPAKKSSAVKTAREAANRVKNAEKNPSGTESTALAVFNQLVPYLLGCLALFITVCYIFTDSVGFVGGWINRLLLGLFSGGAYTMPLFILNIAVNWRRDRENRTTRYKLIFSFICLIFISVLLHAATTGASRPASVQLLRSTLSLPLLWSCGISLDGGGAIGGFLGSLMLRGVGGAGTLILSISALIIFGLFLFGLTPHSAVVYIAYYIHKKREESAQNRENQGQYLREPPQDMDHAVVPQEQTRSDTQTAAVSQNTDRTPRGDRVNPENIKQNPDYDPDIPIDGIPYSDYRAKEKKRLFGDRIDFDAEIGDETTENINTAESSVGANSGEQMENTVDSDAFDAALKSPAAQDPHDGEDEISITRGDSGNAKKTFIAPLPLRGKIIKRAGERTDSGVDLDAIFSENADNPAVRPSPLPYPGEQLAADVTLHSDAQPDVMPEDIGDTKDIFGDIDADDIIKPSGAPNKSVAPKIIPMHGTQTEGGFVLTSSAETNKKKADDAPIIDPELLASISRPLEIERRRITVDTSTGEVLENHIAPGKQIVYELPPPTLLHSDAPPKNEDVTEELQTTAKKLVDTLNSFKVRTRIVNISRGPTITRYELAPDEGVRVRSISNLVDDISLNLATTGVRIEAPIPGKSAVGIEVPNRVVATVYLRDLIENQKFKASKSKICVSLGMDVAGEPIYLDIAKMPHLLIAGATGMGKSVCINSMIVSLLYKSTPEEVKLILVDPKKVELNIYNGLPHLLVPVVSDPKKAAGSLHWAVTEMERRFELIETEGVRDLMSYNASVEAEISRELSCQKQKLPQIVIIIDELADLMMTAPDDVEESICRLAQKARAAGMHLVIGTQRPSVDVITGLIKANIPSRIAFTVASQVDSRTIIDITGAEKLIGRGDMLYAPVGSSKPIRVQGAFVSETDIDGVTDFIKRQSGDIEYDHDVIDNIEKAAEACGNGKKGSGGAAASADDDGENADPMLKPAIELAVDSGKISTSLIQRRLSLGYGRAAKLIDRMEQLGYVSAPEGQKPRNVLITKQQYMEMVLNRDEFD